jgi:methylenetetrahydrofolate--tRNA-(uracil-5-)-methyltransferase
MVYHSPMSEQSAIVIGGGLAGSEAAWALANRGVKVTLHEMRPEVGTPAHQTGRLAELVCSNSFKSVELVNAHGLLKAELRLLGSLLLDCADQARVPGGSALVVDREVFSAAVDTRLRSHPNISVATGEVSELPAPGIVATGPLTSEALATAIAARLGSASLAFYDAIAPIVSDESLDHTPLYRRSRYEKGDGDDYLNSPLTREEYESFITALGAADQFHAHEFDAVPYFEGCLPVEEMARRGAETLRFGPMKPVGLEDPRTGKEPYAVVQFRREDKAGQMWNLVGFQTRLRIPEQQRVFRQIPGLGNAEFLRYGSIHRNAYINSPASLGPGLTTRDAPPVFFAGQLTGVEGYTESLGTGILAGINLHRLLTGKPIATPPPTTMLGGLLRYLSEADPKHFQPMNANMGLLEPLPQKVKKADKRAALVERALAEFGEWVGTLGGRVAEGQRGR